MFYRILFKLSLFLLLPILPHCRFDGRIVFPDDQLPTFCFAHDGSGGTCKLFSDCYPDGEIKGDLELCYFLNSNYYICCPIHENIKKITTTSAPPPVNLRIRPADQACPKVQYVLLGLPTEIKEFPYMVSLGWRNKLNNSIYDYRCGGVLLWQEFILTAAHCAESEGERPAVALLGGLNLTDPAADIIGIKNIIIHPDYTPNLFYNDIAVMELEEQPRKEKACIHYHKEPNNKTVVVIGYGNTKFAGKRSNQLLKAYLQVIPNEECSKFYPSDETLPNGIIDSQICARDISNIRDSCEGDSGGPIIMRENDFDVYHFVVGITSFGNGCAGGQPGVYTRVSAYAEWIEKIIWPNGEVKWS